MSNSPPGSRLGIVSIIIFLGLVYLLFTIYPKTDLNSAHSYGAVCAIVLSFNIAIIFAWIGSGIFAGTMMFIVSLFAALTGVLRSGCYNAAVFSWSFVFAALLGYRHWRAIKNIEYSTELNSEKTEEEINMLSDDLRKKEAEAKYLEGKLSRYGALKDVAESLATTLTMEDIAKIIVEKTAATIKNTGRILLFLVDVQKQELMLSASRGPLKVKTKKGDIFDRWVLKHVMPLIVEDVTQDFRFSSADTGAAKEYFKSLITTPLLAGNKVIGILRIDSPAEGLYTHDDLRLLDMVGGLGSVAIQNALLYIWVEELAIHDSLTGLFVRRYFLKRLHEELHRAAKRNDPLSLLMLDIDRFKWYNDKYGHATGDIVLKHITDNVSGLLRQGDMAARYGGEEIAILLAGTDIKKAEKRAEAIRKRIEDNPITVRRERHNITVSIGAASYPKDSVLEEELVKAADDRLYKAKSLGRNRVCAG